MKIDAVKVIKIGSFVLSVVAAGGTAWASGKENEKILANLVEKKFQNQ